MSCDRFPEGSRRRAICDGTADLSPEKINAYRATWGMEPIAIEPKAVAPVVHVGAQAVRVKRVSQQSSKPCASCTTAAIPQKSWKEKQVERIANLAKASVDFVRDGMQFATEEQQQSRLTICKACPVYNAGWCDQSKGGCGCNVSLKVKARAASCPAWKWHSHTDFYQPLENPTRNLIFHIYPLLGAEWNWHWHIEQIRQHQHLFNGRIVIAIVTGRKLATAEAVQKQMAGIRVDEWIVKPNSRLAETVTMPDLLRAVKTDDPNAITFRGHCKGVTHGRERTEQPWARMMWDACMDISSVEDALASHIMAGPMKCHEPLVSTQRYKWFYAGTFFWFRNQQIFERSWERMEQTRWYPEAWPGMLCTNEESACLLHDFTDGSVIGAEYWKAVVEPDIARWRAAR